MKNQLVLIAEEPNQVPATATTEPHRTSRSTAARRRAERTHARADRAREALREAAQRATEREAARRRAREQALLAAAAQPRLTGVDSPVTPPPSNAGRGRAA